MESIFEIGIVMLSVIGLLWIGIFIGREFGSLELFFHKFVLILHKKLGIDVGEIELSNNYPFSTIDVYELTEHIIISQDKKRNNLTDHEKSEIIMVAEKSIQYSMRHATPLKEAYELVKK